MTSSNAKLQFKLLDIPFLKFYFNIKFVALIVLIRFICMSKMAITKNYFWSQKLNLQY